MSQTHTADGRQIVQVRYYGQSSRRGYTYCVAKELGDLELHDYVWTPGTYVAPWGQVAAVIEIGSEYTGEMMEITQKIDKGYDPQTVTVQRYQPPGR